MELDPVDKAYLDSIVPEGCIPDGLITVVAFTSPEGEPMWKVHSSIDAPLSSSLGLLELAKLHLIARTDCGIPLSYGEDGDAEEG